MSKETPRWGYWYWTALAVAALSLIVGLAIKLAPYRTRVLWYDRWATSVALLVTVVGVLSSLVVVLSSLFDRSVRELEMNKLEIKSKDGSVLATDVDPANIEVIAKVVQEAKSASQ